MVAKPTYKYFTQYDAANYTKGRGRYAAPVEIVIHHWGVDGQRFQDVVNFFTRPSTQTSAHYVACAGNVACLVDLKDTAWHAGDWNENQRSVGIECRPECTPADMDTVAQLIAQIWHAYPNMSRKLRFHKEFSATACPGRWQAKLPELEKLALNYLNNKVPQPQPAPQPQYKTLNKGDVATIANHATHTMHGSVIDKTMHGKSGIIKDIINIKQSVSTKAYLVDGIKDHILEQDITQARGGKVDKIIWLQQPQTPSQPTPSTTKIVENNCDTTFMKKIDELEKLTVGKATITRGNITKTALEEIAEIRTTVAEIKTVLDKVFK